MWGFPKQGVRLKDVWVMQEYCVDIYGLGFPKVRDTCLGVPVSILENQMAKKMENEMETVAVYLVIGMRVSQN